MSRIAVTLLAPWNAVASIASHTDPSAISESPNSTHTRAAMSSIRIASAIPSPAASPCPREPVATSTHGNPSTGAG